MVVSRHSRPAVFGELLRKGAGQGYFGAVAVGYRHELSPDNGNHPALVDELHQVVPEEFLDGVSYGTRGR